MPRPPSAQAPFLNICPPVPIVQTASALSTTWEAGGVLVPLGEGASEDVDAADEGAAGATTGALARATAVTSFDD